MHYVRQFFQAVGMFWGITIIVLVLAGGTILGLVKFGYFLDSQNVSHQAQINNKSYQAQVQSDMYQQTFLSQAGKDYQQVTADKFNVYQAKASGDQNEIADAYAASAADIHVFCTAAQHLTDFTRAQFTPQESDLYANAC